MFNEYDVYVESVFFGLYRNYNLEPCLKTGGIVIFGLTKPGNLITIGDEEDRVRVHVNDKVYIGTEEITLYIVKYGQNSILPLKFFEDRIGYRFTVHTKEKMKEMAGSEAIFFLDNRIKVEEYRM